MGMISCRDCGKVLSRSAKRCPLCGAIKPGRSSVEYYLHPGRQPAQRDWDAARAGLGFDWSCPRTVDRFGLETQATWACSFS